MAKFCGQIGFIKTVETEPGIWEESLVEEKKYYGDITRNIFKYQNNGQVNDNINISNTISIISDPYANNNLQYMKYVVFNGAKWKILNIDIQPPRLILTLGDLYE